MTYLLQTVFHGLVDFFDYLYRTSRYPHFYREQGLLTRDLYKVYGIRILVRVTGEAGKFSIVPLLLTIGSGIGLLAVVSKIFMFLCYHKFVKEITKDELSQIQTKTESFAKKKQTCSTLSCVIYQAISNRSKRTERARLLMFGVIHNAVAM